MAIDPSQPNELIGFLGTIDSATGVTKWETLMRVIRKEAESGDPRWTKLLKEAEAIDGIYAREAERRQADQG